jgi:hypothetical protein
MMNPARAPASAALTGMTKTRAQTVLAEADFLVYIY